MTCPHYQDADATLYVGDCREVLASLPESSARTCVTSPPYWGLRDYGVASQLGVEATPEEYVANLVEVFREVRRVLTADGTLWLNLGDNYAGSWGAQGRQGKTGALAGRTACAARQVASAQKRERMTGSLSRTPGLKNKDLVGIPWRVAFALQADGWWLRSDIIWAKPNPMPESVTDRPTKSHEYVFLLAKSERYFYDAQAARERDGGLPAGNGFRGRQGGSARATVLRGGAGTLQRWQPGRGRNARSVWHIATRPSGMDHFATMPPELAQRCILAGSAPGDTVLDPFSGAGTTGLVAMQHGRRYLGVEMNPRYAEDSVERWAGVQRALFSAGGGR